MADKKKHGSKPEKPEMNMPDMEMPDMEMPEVEMPILGGKCPMLQGCPMMCPTMCPMMCPVMPGHWMQAPYDEYQMMDMMRTEDIRKPVWYEEDDSDYSSDESDDYYVRWIQKEKNKYSPCTFFWPSCYYAHPYKKKKKKW